MVKKEKKSGKCKTESKINENFDKVYNILKKGAFKNIIIYISIFLLITTFFVLEDATLLSNDYARFVSLIIALVIISYSLILLSRFVNIFLYYNKLIKRLNKFFKEEKINYELFAKDFDFFIQNLADHTLRCSKGKFGILKCYKGTRRIFSKDIDVFCNTLIVTLMEEKNKDKQKETLKKISEFLKDLSKIIEKGYLKSFYANIFKIHLLIKDYNFYLENFNDNYETYRKDIEDIYRIKIERKENIYRNIIYLLLYGIYGITVSIITYVSLFLK